MRRGCLRAEVLMRYRESRHAVFIGSQQVQFTMRGGVARIPHEARGEHGIQCFRGALSVPGVHQIRHCALGCVSASDVAVHKEDEHSCFSDNTLADQRANLAGIEAFLRHLNDPEASVLALLNWKSPATALRLDSVLTASAAALAKIPEPFDAVILSAPDDPRRVQAEQAAEKLQELARTMKAAAEVLGMQIVVPGV